MDPYRGAPPSHQAAWTPEAPAKQAVHGKPQGPTDTEGADAFVTAIEKERLYSLPQLIDLAQQNNPSTRKAWYQARSAAIDVGLAEAAYFPVVKLLALGMYERGVFALPPNVLQQGFFNVDAYALRPELSVQWLLFDFGAREAMVREAEGLRDAGNELFNAAHEQVVFSVTTAYYRLALARSTLELSEASLDDASTIEKAVRLSREHGMATEPELLQGVQNQVRAQWDYEVARSSARDASVQLAQAVGVNPAIPIRIMGITGEPDVANLRLSIDVLIERALSKRPDLRALGAAVRSATAAIGKAEASLLPTIGVSGNVGPAWNGFQVDGFPWVSTNEWLYGGVGLIEWPLFKGFADFNLVKKAESAKQSLEQGLAEARNAAIREVWLAYTAAQNATRKKKVADALLLAAEETYAAMLSSYQGGMATLQDVLTAQVGLAGARSNAVETKTEVRVALSALALATGQMAPSGPMPPPAPGAMAPEFRAPPPGQRSVGE